MLLGKGVEGFRVWGRGWYQCLINVLQWFLEGSGFHGWGSSLQFKLIGTAVVSHIRHYYFLWFLIW